MFDVIMCTWIGIGLIMAFWTQFWLKLAQLAIVCAVIESDYFWHWAPKPSALPSLLGFGLALIITGYWCSYRNGDFSREGRARRRTSPPPLWLLRLRGQPGQLLTGDDGSQRGHLR